MEERPEGRVAAPVVILLVLVVSGQIKADDFKIRNLAGRSRGRIDAFLSMKSFIFLRHWAKSGPERSSLVLLFLLRSF